MYLIINVFWNFPKRDVPFLVRSHYFSFLIIRFLLYSLSDNMTQYNNYFKKWLKYLSIIESKPTSQ